MRKRNVASGVVAVTGVLAASLLVSERTLADEGGHASQGRLWLDFGIGLANVDTSSAPFGDSSAGFMTDLTVGGRLSDRWLLGLNIGGAGSQIGNNNYNSNDQNSNVYGQALTNVFLAAQFEPGVDHGWIFGVAAGHVLYHNRQLEDYSGNTRSGDGSGALVRVGYDWRTSPRLHLLAELSGETAHITLGAPFGGSFTSSIVGASVHVAFQ